MTAVKTVPLSSSAVRLTLRVDEGSRVYCAAFQSDPGYDASSYENGIKNSGSCMDMHKIACGSFWVYDLDDIEDGANDGVTSQSGYGTALYRADENVKVLLTGLAVETKYTHIFCYAEDDETDGLGSMPNKVSFAAAVAFQAGIGSVTTLDESPPYFTSILAKSTSETAIQVTFVLSEAGTVYCRAVQADSYDPSIPEILRAGWSVVYPVGGGVLLMTQPTKEAVQYPDAFWPSTFYDVFCYGFDTAGNAMSEVAVQTDSSAAPPTSSGSNGGKVAAVRMMDTTVPALSIVSVTSSPTTITVLVALDEPGTAACNAFTTVQVSPGYSAVATFSNVLPAADLPASIVVTGLDSDTLYYVYCAAQDDEAVEGASTIDPAPVSNVMPAALDAAPGGWRTVDDVVPVLSGHSVRSESGTTLTASVVISEPGTIHCDAFVYGSGIVPASPLDITAGGFSIAVLTAGVGLSQDVVIAGLRPDTEYRVYCTAEDSAGNVVPMATTLSGAAERRFHTITNIPLPAFSPGTGVSFTQATDANANVLVALTLTYTCDISYGNGDIMLRSDVADVLITPGDANDADGTALIMNPPQVVEIRATLLHTYMQTLRHRLIIPVGVFTDVYGYSVLPLDDGVYEFFV
jgi:hypothetical protein